MRDLVVRTSKFYFLYFYQAIIMLILVKNNHCFPLTKLLPPKIIPTSKIVLICVLLINIPGDIDYLQWIHKMFKHQSINEI
jgi:hypothetical protein